MTGRSIERTRRPNAVTLFRPTILHDHDHDLLDECTLPDAVRHARKLCGFLPYSLAEVKPAVSARYIYMLIAMNARLMGCKSVARVRELEGENKRLLAERSTIRREMQRWGLEMPRYAQRELPFNGEGKC